MSNYNYSCIIYILNRTNSYLKCAPGLSNDWGSPQNYVAYLSKWYAKADENTLAFIQNKIAIGEYNTIEHKDIAVRREKLNEGVANINQQLNQSHSYQLSQRQAAARSLQQWSYQQQLLQQNQQMINSINRPTTTNCRYVDSTINCTSY